MSPPRIKKHQRGFNRELVNAIIDISRVPTSCEQLMSAMFMDKAQVKRYVLHLMRSEALIVDHKIRKRIFYKSTGKYNPPELLEPYINRDISVRSEIKTNFVPFRDSWTELFFGTYKTPSQD